MSCYQVYKTQYKDAVDYPKVLGTFADDYTGGTACILPYKVVNTFQDRSAPDFITASKCEFNHPQDASKSIKLDPTETGCRIDFATLSRDDAKAKLDILQSLYDKNVIEKKLALQAELNRKYEELAITQSNFDEKKKKLDETTQIYYRYVADSNALVRERDELRRTQAAEAEKLKRLREDIDYAKKEADITVDNLNKTIEQGDNFINFVAVSEHVGYDGSKVSLSPQIYEWTRQYGNFGISSVIIPPGMTVKVWVGQNFSGQQYKMDHGDGKKANFLTITYRETRYRTEGFTQDEETDTEPETKDKTVIETFLPLIALAALHKKNKNKQKKHKKHKKRIVPYEVELNFNDNVACIEVQKEKSVGEFMDSWGGGL